MPVQGGQGFGGAGGLQAGSCGIGIGGGIGGLSPSGGSPGRSGTVLAIPVTGIDRPLNWANGKKGPGRPAAGADAKPGQKNALVADLHDGSNAERYGTYLENEFRSPLVAALSTFSADVNTASYSNVRRMLNQGTLPPKDAVFVAEFVNYFPYQYAHAEGRGSDRVQPRDGAVPVEPQAPPRSRRRAGLSDRRRQDCPPRNLVFLIDTSGSMSEPNRLPLVKQAINLLVDQLGEKDRVSVVTYAGDSRVALGPTAGSEKDRIKEVVTGLQSSGGTNGEGGIKNAYRLARETFIDGGVNRVILCTDGDFNIGLTNQGELRHA